MHACRSTLEDPTYPGFGNPELKPEKARNIEVSLSGALGRWSYGVNAFRTRVDELIGFDADFVPANIDRALIEGVEGQLGARWERLKVQAWLTWLRPRNDGGGADDGNVLPRRRARTARVDADYAIRKVSLGMTLFGTSHGYDDLANTTQLAGYGLLDLRSGWQVLPEWLIQLEGRNVLNRHYETAAGYANYGASFMATVRFTPAHS